ncbi:hypothetical protein AnigIFM63604_008969 [Aspergillus niger]|uniref:Contig An02c0080, genomic contig n=3 Tax=Aspergillus niger TaxID=5061 RepID=A2QC96_ASPNC|nr:uncharacterized protein An02g02760 [Aspergillus niger]GKZ94682.1 hypothetical protein AnigIFM59636_008064 [Aspergillus niger]GLA25981.1 hypothetical protein AnigIFM63326_002774 [Aspergillus niger]GLA46181.1 hypothetical protein AnigIFM63604_008969 [Aspergillus niger]CAK47560.1 unnamed protein product [Aspergillus niger]
MSSGNDNNDNLGRVLKFSHPWVPNPNTPRCHVHPLLICKYIANLVGGLGDTLGKTVGGLGDTVGSTVGGLGQTVGGATQGLGKTVGGATEGLGNTTRGVGQSTGDILSSINGDRSGANAERK